jgi:four helix bundle protein
MADELQARADAFGVRLAIFLRALPHDPVTETIARQLARAGTSIASNYRATRRARSRAEFIARLAVVVEEADETVHWLPQIRDARLASGDELAGLVDEAKQLLAIFARSLATAKRNHALQKAAAPPRDRRG